MGSIEKMQSLAPSEKSAEAGHGNKQNGPKHRNKSKFFFKNIRSRQHQYEEDLAATKLDLHSLHEKVDQIHINLNKLTDQNNHGQANDNDQFENHANVFRKMKAEHAKDHDRLDAVAELIQE